MDANQTPGTSYGPDNVNAHGTTEVNVEHCSFLWTVINYSSLRAKPFILSPMFRGGPITNHLWQFKVIPEATFDDQVYFGIKVILRQYGVGGGVVADRPVNARLKITVLNENGLAGKEAGSMDMPACKFRLNTVWGYEKFVLSNALEAADQKLLNEDCIRIHVALWIEGDVKQRVCIGGAIKRGVDLDKKAKRLATVYDKVFADNRNKDFKVITTTGEIKVHKSFLQAWSEVFEAMFNNDMTEKQKNQVQVMEFEHEVVYAMIEYMYTGKTNSMNENATELLKISEKYGVAELKEESEYVVANNITIDNSAELLYLAETYKANFLKKRVVNYMKWYRDKVVDTDGFKRIEKDHPSLFKIFYVSV